ncbi:MAG: hypothetical protein OQJ98_00865 [Candidatus Pacebacteria bacterium]|nr:hypothetical protein [Candidatus Paceibacterota bacterium]
MTDTYGAQEAQDLIDLSVKVEGFDNWHDALATEIEIGGIWAKETGKTKASLLEVCDVMARINRISREIAYFSTLINEGYQLEDAVVSFRGDEEDAWGKCTWIKDHPSYKDPEHRLRDMFKSDCAISFASAFFDTEHAGEQRFTLQSVAVCNGFLFHKTILFHRVVFSKPKQTAEEAA